MNHARDGKRAIPNIQKKRRSEVNQFWENVLCVILTAGLVAAFIVFQIAIAGF
jgi:hypothetical protein